MTVPGVLDHLVLATPDVAATATWLLDTTGVAPSVGGPHVGRGTRNVLCSLGDGIYLEIIGPDPEQDEPSAPRPFGVDLVTGPALVTWCVRPADLDEHVRIAAAAGVEYGEPEGMSRRSPSGLLEWRLAMVRSDDDGGIIPFAIDWGATAHPSRTAAAGLRLEAIAARHPTPQRLETTLAALGVDLDIATGRRAGLAAVLVGPAGRIELGSPGRRTSGS